MMGMMIREACESDRDLLLQWRNDPQTRANSHDQNIVSTADHAKWFAATLQNPARKLFIAEVDGAPVGVVRVDIHSKHCELSWTVAPSARGKGFGKEMVKQVAQQTGGRLTAVVKVGNLPSISVAEAAGLRQEYVENGLIYFSGNLDVGQ